MINFDYLEQNKDELRMQFLLNKPFPFLCIDNFCDQEALMRGFSQLPDIDSKSRDYVFAKNKFEKSRIDNISPEFKELYEDLLSDKFKKFLCYISNEEVFVDERFHGGGIHQAKEGAFLDMHLDFNYHPMHPDWFRNLNLLLYLNPDWKDEYGGHLNLEDLRTGEKTRIGIPFNRMVIQQTRSFTLHGFSKLNFPEGKYRTSVASYAYTLHKQHVEKPRTTDWFPEDGQPVKQFLARIYDPAVKIKNKLFGSSTAKNYK